MIENKEITVRRLVGSDLPLILELEKEAENYANDPSVSFFVEDMDPDQESMAYGIFEKDNLIGFCSLGYSDIDRQMNRAKGYVEGYLLSDLYIKKEMQRKGYGSLLIQEILRRETEPIYLTPIGMIEDGYSGPTERYFARFGFRPFFKEYMRYEGEKL